VGARLERGTEQGHHEARIRSVHEHIATVPPEQPGRGLLVAGAQRYGLVSVAGRRGALRPAQVVVGDDQLSERAAGGNPRKCRADAAGADQEYAHGPILTSAFRLTRPAVISSCYYGYRCRKAKFMLEP
jgi:hypothetical protein